MIMETFTQVLAQYMGLLWLTITFPIYTIYYMGENNGRFLIVYQTHTIYLKKKERNEEILFTLFTFFLGIIGTILPPFLILILSSGYGILLGRNSDTVQGYIH